MRRKSNRNAAKATPEKPPETQRKTRRQSKRQRKSLSRSSSEDSEEKPIEPQQPLTPVAVEEKPVATEEEPEQPIWKVTPSSTPSGEIQKLKFCLTRPLMSPEKERTSRRRRNKSGGQTDEDISTPGEKVLRNSRHRGSSGDNVDENEEEHDHQEDKKGKGKSKTKNKSKSEKTPQIQDIEDNSQSEISENVQVTPQSPQASIDTRVDNESISTIESETVTDETENPETLHHNENSFNECETEIRSMEFGDFQNPSRESQSNTPPPILEKHVDRFEKQNSDSEEYVKGFEAPHLSRADTDEQLTKECSEDVTVETEPTIKQTQEESIIPEVAQKEKNKSDGKEAAGMDTSEPLLTREGEPEIDQHKNKIHNVVQEEKSESNVKEMDTSEPLIVRGESKHDQAQQENATREVVEEEKCETEFKDDVTIDTSEVDGKPEVQENIYKVGQEEESENNIKEGHEMDTSEPEPVENIQVTATVDTLDKNVELGQTPIDLQESDNSSEAAELTSNNRNNKIVSESPTKSMEVDENHSDDDSVSRDATMDTTSQSLKENTTFDITQSFSPDIKQMEEVNEELQTMKYKATELLQTPTRVTRKWGSEFVGLESIKDSLQKIDINTIREFCPALQFLDESDVKIDVRERKASHSQEPREKRKVSIDYKRLDTQVSVTSSEMEETPETEADNSNIIAMNRKISIVDDTASKLKPPPSPAKNPISEILYITNLVRPFTLKQLKELLERTGKIKENGFWTDRIKSKCYSHYESIEEAEATRNALHGVNWPIGNGKKLIIEYATDEDFEKARNPTPPPVAVATVSQPILEEPKPTEKDVVNEAPKNNYKVEEENKGNKERQRHRSEGHVREWDVGKENLQKSRYRNKELDERDDRNDRHKRRRTPSPTDDFLSRKEKKKEEDVPQKLMDDLFRKTKTTPSIYWLPLTPEEIATKQQQRLLRMAEHKRRMEESSRSRGDYGRGAPYRRRYD